MTSTPTPAPEPSTQERLAWMGKNSKKLIIALVVIIIAALVVTFSFSLFSSSSANPGNMVGTGSIEIENSDEGLAIFTVAGLLPGESDGGTVTIENVGDSEGDFSLTADNLVDTPAGTALSSVLVLVINDGTTDVYAGPFASVGTVQLGTWQPAEAHTYTFTVTMADSAGNEFQDAQTELDFTWNATQNSD